MLRVNFAGDSNIGLYGFATDKYLINGHPSKEGKKIAKKLKIKLIKAMVMNTYFAGIFLAGNSNGIVASKFIDDYGFTNIEHDNILYLNTKHTAFGNMMTFNNKGGIISPSLNRYKKEIEDFLDIKMETSTIAGMKIPGSCILATDKGCVVHPKITEKEKTLVEKTFQVPVFVGTVNYGSPYVRSGLIANSKDFATSIQSTGPELGNITESLGFL